MIQIHSNVSMWINNNRFIIELILAVLVTLAAAMKFLSLAGADEALMLTMLTLASFYFLSGVLLEQENTVVSVVSRVFGIASAVSMIGLLFAFLQLPGAREQLLIGLLSMAVCAVITIFLAVTGRSQKFVPMLIRVVVLGGISLNAWLGLGSLPVH